MTRATTTTAVTTTAKTSPPSPQLPRLQPPVPSASGGSHFRRLEPIRRLNDRDGWRAMNAGTACERIGRLFRQTNLLAQGSQTWIAAKQSAILAIHTEQKPAYSNRSCGGIFIQCFENSVLFS